MMIEGNETRKMKHEFNQRVDEIENAIGTDNFEALVRLAEGDYDAVLQTGFWMPHGLCGRVGDARRIHYDLLGGAAA